ncbi:recombinase family protein [Mesorhizobium sp. M0809]|uniref:recombinase family protein n=1 Tax=Mesorhizobium sp. M0809 TaxID=2957003 RepID=UPI0033382DE9
MNAVDLWCDLSGACRREQTVGPVPEHLLHLLGSRPSGNTNLAAKAQALGWSPERIRILDRDLGQSGSQATHREDFKTLVSTVAMGQVGVIFSLEASRLARSNQDGDRLLELCAITGILVIDEDGCYDPAEFNDGLVLGMKGTFAKRNSTLSARASTAVSSTRRKKASCALPCPSVCLRPRPVVLDPDQ